MSQTQRTAFIMGIAVLVLIGMLWSEAEFGSSALAQSLPSEAQVLATITQVNNYWISQNPTPGNSDWTQATYFTGDLAAYDATGQSNYLSFAQSWASAHNYSLDSGNNTNYANYQAAGQVYIRLYQLLGNASDISGITQSINGMVNSTVVDEWTWIDAINMSMPDFAELGAMEGNTSYFNKMYSLYSYTKDTLGLYDPVVGLWWEESYYANTSTYWSRGNGWVFAAHAKVLSVLPTSDPHYAEYLSTFETMAAALAQRQQPGGYWNSDLGGTDYAGPETSGTSFFLYGIAWGLNNNILDKQTYLPIAENAWNFLANTAVQPSGLLGYVQPADTGPGPTTATTTEDFGVGAFLLAARQMQLLTAQNNVPPTCTSNAPTVSITPASQNITSGGSDTYTVSITNNDSGASCTSTTFSLAASDTNSNNFNASTVSPTPVVLSPGRSSNSTLTVSAKAAQLSGTDSTTVTATASGHANGVSNAVTTSVVTKYTIKATAGTGGSIHPGGTTTLNSGGSQTYTITPSSGYSISGVQVDGVSVGAVSSYTFSDVTANHTISATFAAKGRHRS